MRIVWQCQLCCSRNRMKLQYAAIVFKAFVTALMAHVIEMVRDGGALQYRVQNTVTSLLLLIFFWLKETVQRV